MYRLTSHLAILEWVIALGFTFYLATFYFDLRLSKGVEKGELAREKLVGGANGPGLQNDAHFVNGSSLGNDYERGLNQGQIVGEYLEGTRAKHNAQAVP